MRLIQKSLSKRFFSTSNQPLLKTRLHKYQVEVLNARMVPFAGYEMPVQYKQGVLKEHLHCRGNASIFDVSHMGQLKIYGQDRVDFIEKLITGDIRSKPIAEGFLSLILNKNAGIVDDTIVTKFEDHIHMVVNGANKHTVLNHMEQLQKEFFSNKDIKTVEQVQNELIAFQGPNAAQYLKEILPDSLNLSDFSFMQHFMTKVPKLGNVDMQVARCGYTGEDGFELSINGDYMEKLVDLLFKNENVQPAGLGARDSLRVEAGLCLHGNDMDQGKSPAECTLMWTVRKKVEGEVHQFLGYEALQQQKKNGIPQKRVAFKVQGKGIVRPPANVVDENDNVIGFVSSGTFSPILQVGVGMMFIEKNLDKVGKSFNIKMKGKNIPVEQCKSPFIQTNYYKK